MAKIKLTRNHIDNVAGDTIEVSDERANYFERVGLSEKEEKKTINTKEDKTKIKTK